MKDYINTQPKQKLTNDDIKGIAICLAMAPVISAVIYGSLKFIQWMAVN